ncbi:uncharacterized protein PG998_008727 [Apiospora kogelbergensis]|uniref:uncharacterized protein n=1 Tax=Apiospora kogelbergensis TaxID=1337665 RepID=UPI0031309AD0
MELKRWEFAPPFRPLVHRWKELNNFPGTTTTIPIKAAATAFLQYLEPIIAPSITSLNQTTATRKVAFSDVCTTVGIESFKGLKRVTDLPLFPVPFLDEEKETRASFIQRGREFERLRGHHLVNSNGTKFQLETKKRILRPISGRVCVDAFVYYRNRRVVELSLQPLDAGCGSQIRVGDSDPIEKSARGSFSDNSSDGSSAGSEPLDEFTAVSAEESLMTKASAERTAEFSPFTGKQCLMSTHWIKAIDLESKKWCEVQIYQLSDVVWNDEAFDKLVSPGDEKELAWAFIENKTLLKTNFDNFTIAGTVVVVLDGRGELGTEPRDVKNSLDRALELCNMWDGILLLDEADIFLGTRTNEDLAQNKPISKYYQGTVFLTTNRISSTDHAVKSRVDLLLPCADLDSTSRRLSWESFNIQHIGRERFDVNEELLDKLSDLPLNGLEIKNLVKSSQLLSLKHGGIIRGNRLVMIADKRVKAMRLV